MSNTVSSYFDKIMASNMQYQDKFDLVMAFNKQDKRIRGLEIDMDMWIDLCMALIRKIDRAKTQHDYSNDTAMQEIFTNIHELGAVASDKLRLMRELRELKIDKDIDE